MNNHQEEDEDAMDGIQWDDGSVSWNLFAIICCIMLYVYIIYISRRERAAAAFRNLRYREATIDGGPQPHLRPRVTRQTHRHTDRGRGGLISIIYIRPSKSCGARLEDAIMQLVGRSCGVLSLHVDIVLYTHWYICTHHNWLIVTSVYLPSCNFCSQ